MMTKSQADYVVKNTNKTCLRCFSFTNNGKTGTCDNVAGEISPRGTCDFWLRAG